MTFRRSLAASPAAAVLLAAILAVSGCADDNGGGEAVPPSGTLVTESSLPDEVQDELEAALVEVMASYDVPGAVVAVATPDGDWVAEAGVADLDTGEPVSEAMAWPLRSLTKSITATVLLQLADEGQLSLEDTIDQYVDGVPNGDRMTLRQLADMTSGVGDYTSSEDFIDALVGDPTRRFELAELNRYGLAQGAQFEPGSDHAYSNTAPNLLGVVIEQVTGRAIADVIQERIISELGLTGTAYPSADEDWPEPHARGYQPSDGDLEVSFNNFSSMGASGAMFSTLADMSEWAEVLGSGALISDELQAERLVGAPLSDGPEYDLYAVGIGELEGWWGHTGEGLGFTSLAMFDPDSTATVVVFMNISQATGEGADGEEEQRHVPTVFMREIASILT